MALIEFEHVFKRYPGSSNAAVDDLNLHIEAGEFLTLLGPSGSGKTTTLMLLAGFEAPSEGTIRLDGQSIESLPPHQRNMGVVFQSYSLFPHMTVAENVAFPLSVRKVDKAVIADKVTAALAKGSDPSTSSKWAPTDPCYGSEAYGRGECELEHEARELEAEAGGQEADRFRAEVGL